MATTLQLYSTYGALSFVGGSDYELEDGGLQINPPNIKEEYRALPGGDIPVGRTLSNRTITIRFSVYGTDEDDLVDNISTLEDRCEQAWKYFTTHGSGYRNSLHVKLGNETNTHYFWVLSGKVVLPGNVYSAAQISQFNASTGTYYIRGVQLILTCKPLVYGTDPTVWATTTYEELINSTWENESDGTGDNGEYESTNLPAGDTLCPLRVELTPYSSTTKRIIMGIGKSQGTYNWQQYVREGEDGTYTNCTSVSNIGPNSQASSDYHKRFNISTTTERGAYATWPTTYPFPTGAFRVFALFSGNIPTNVKFQLAMEYAFSGFVDYGQIAYRPAEAIFLYALDLGTFYNPARNDPYLASQTLKGNPNPVLYFWTTDGVSTQIDFDAIYVIPQDLGYRIIEFKGDPLDSNGTVFDDAFQESLFVGDGGTNVVPDCEGLHNQLYVPANQPFVMKALLLSGPGFVHDASATYNMKVYGVSSSLSYGAF